jgi:hypothetical protein
MVTETGLWYLIAKHPEAVEKVSDEEFWLYLERPYRARRMPDRAYYALTLPCTASGCVGRSRLHLGRRAEALLLEPLLRPDPEPEASSGAEPRHRLS